ncbi:uncharacterized protein [Arachis hypogaea]|uniref:uncharacterized protein n=1 Tax=Arachis hypogaea TaxID=3818 RepID=UPI000DEC3CEC|nr:uncharacterized protein LOC112795195 [Arachis hypogaea]
MLRTNEPLFSTDDVISKACCGFAESATQNREDFLQMLILRKEIPAWFEHQEEDDGVSVSFPQNCPSIETIALALCFLIEIEEYIDAVQPLVIYNGYHHDDLDIGRRYGARWVTKCMFGLPFKHGKEERENQKWRLGQKERRRGGKDRRRRLGTAGLPHARSAAVEAAPFIPAQSRFDHHHPVSSPEECHEGERKLVRAGERKEALVGRRTLPSIAIEPRRTQNCEREGCDTGADTRKRECACARRRRVKLLSPPLVSCAAVDLAAETVAVLYGRADERDLKVCWESSHRAQPLFASPAPPRSELPPSEKGSGRQGWFSTPGTTAGVSGYFFRRLKKLYRYQRRSPVAAVT